MDHPEAIETGAAERYALGQMNETERDQYEEHFFDCPECADEVRAAAIFVDNAKGVAKEAVDAVTDDRLSTPEPPAWWVGLKASFWPVPLGAAATLILWLGGPMLYLAFFKLPQLEQARAQAEGLQVAPFHFLSVSRGAPLVVRVSGTQRMLGLTLSKSEGRTFPSYLCEVRDADGRVVLSNVVAAPPRGGELQILFPTGKLKPGAHVVAVAGLEASSSRPSASDFTRYPFIFERE